MITRYNFANGGFFPADNGMWVKGSEVERYLSLLADKYKIDPKDIAEIIGEPQK